MENIIFGKKAILDAINNDIKIKVIKCIQLPNELKNHNIKVEYVKPNFFHQYKEVNHQNIIAIVEDAIKHLGLEELIAKSQKTDHMTILMIDENEDPRNFGSIIRSAASFNVDAIIYKNKNQAPINDLVIKASMGAVYSSTFVKVANLNQAIDKLKEAGFWIYATGLTDKAQPLSKTKWDNKSVVIVGNENKGVSDLTLKKSDFVVKIEMSEKVQSLNISVATGIVLYHLFASKKN